MGVLVLGNHLLGCRSGRAGLLCSSFPDSVWLWADCLTSLSLVFLMYGMEVDYCED